jgi:hypothetical protein
VDREAFQFSCYERAVIRTSRTGINNEKQEDGRIGNRNTDREKVWQGKERRKANEEE